MVHDLGLRHQSPFVNLYLSAHDYIKYLKNITYYNNLGLVKLNTEANYPMGVLGDLIIHFLHYKNFNEAKSKWNERVKRINLNSLYLIFVERDGATYKDLQEFDRLPYKNKIALTHREYFDIKCSFCIKGFEKDDEVGLIYDWKGPNSVKKLYDQFDFVCWLNTGDIKRNKLMT